MSAQRTRTNMARQMDRLSETILPTVCTIIMRLRHYTTVTDEMKEACIEYEREGQNISDERLQLLRSITFTAYEYMIARREYPSECEY